jgi:hypothetical protein
VIRRALAVAASLLAAGCAPRELAYAPAGGFYRYAPGFEVALPAGWVRTPRALGLTATRDGLLLQSLWVHVERVSRSRLALPEEHAALVAERFEAGARWKVDDVRPAVLSGAPGWRIAGTYRDADGLAYGAVIVGAVIGDRRWTVGYAAPARHYFALDLPTFDRAVASFRVVAPP